MTQDEVIVMAKQAWADAGDAWVAKEWFDDRAKAFEGFAKLVAAKEREACAKVCESIYTNGDGAECWLENAASKIRARGEQA
jgi:hypothetical protein